MHKLCALCAPAALRLRHCVRRLPPELPHCVLGTASRRCYPIWMDFSECMSKAEDPKACKDFRDDYLECLHHRKEVRQGAVQQRVHPALPPAVAAACRLEMLPWPWVHGPASIALLGRLHSQHGCAPRPLLHLAQPCCTPVTPVPQFTKLNQFFREEKRQRDGGSSDANGHGGGH